MKTLVCSTPGKLEIEDRSMPVDVPSDWALVKIDHVGLCGTDFHIYEGLHPFLEYPRVMGHELSGTLQTAFGHFSKGQRVIINPYIACGSCHACQQNKPNCCYHIQVLGVHRDGGLCEQISVPQTNIYPAGDLPAEQVAMVEFLAIGAHAVRRSQITKGQKTLVVGVGPIGLGTALFARENGAEVYLRDFNADRLAMVQERFGFKTGFGKESTDIDILKQSDNNGYDVVFDATGNKTAIENGFKYIAHGGKYVLVSIVQGNIHFSDPEFHKREATLIGSRNATREDFDRVVTSLSNGSIDGRLLNTHTTNLEDLPNLMPNWLHDRDQMIKAIVRI